MFARSNSVDRALWVRAKEAVTKQLVEQGIIQVADNQLGVPTPSWTEKAEAELDSSMLNTTPQEYIEKLLPEQYELEKKLFQARKRIEASLIEQGIIRKEAITSFFGDNVGSQLVWTAKAKLELTDANLQVGPQSYIEQLASASLQQQ